MRRALRPVLAALLIVGACFPDYQVAPGGTGDAGADSTAPGGDDATAGDAGGDSTAADAGGEAQPACGTSDGGPQTVANADSVAAESGNSQQVHLVFAKNSGRYWLFYIDDDTLHLKTRWSVDFTCWNDGASLTLPMAHGTEGRNFSVAYRDFGGTDVVHVATSLHDSTKRIVYDTRATIAGDTITFGLPQKVHDIDTIDTWVDAAYQATPGSQGGNGCDPDGTGVVIASDGHVHVATSWVSVPGCCYCDSNFTRSTSPDLGSSWNPGFVSPLQHYSVIHTTNARQLVALDGGTVLAAFDDGTDDVTPLDVTWAEDLAGTWSDEPDAAAFPVFPSSGFDAMNKNDWSLCHVDDAHVHALRRGYTNLDFHSKFFEHYVFDGQTWTQQPAPPGEQGTPGSGVVLLTNGTSFLAAAISDNQSVRYSVWSGGAWTPWADLAGVAPGGGTIARHFLSSTGCGDPAHPVLLWTEGTGPYQLVAVPVSSLMP